MTTDIRAFAIDLGERAAATFGQSFISVMVGAQLTSWSEVKQVASAAALAGGAAVLALLKGVIGGVRTGTASVSKTVAAAAQIEGATFGSIPVTSDVNLAPAAATVVEPMPAAEPVAPAAPPAVG